MGAPAAAFVYALFVWWFSTGLVFLVVLRQPSGGRGRGARAGLIGAAVLYPLCLAALARTAAVSSLPATYAAFTIAILLWGTQEVAFLTGAVTGPRPLPCPENARGLRRFGYAVAAILWHELALAATGLGVLAATWGQPNQAGALAYAVLWAMRVSSKLNLFFGVPNLNDAIMPAPVAHLRSYFRRAPINDFFPIAVLAALAGVAAMVLMALDPAAQRPSIIGYALAASLLALAILEHLFMLVPLPIDRLWRWSTRAVRGS